MTSKVLGATASISPRIDVIFRHLLSEAFLAQFSTDQGSISTARTSSAPSNSARIAKTPVPEPMSSICFPLRSAFIIASHIM